MLPTSHHSPMDAETAMTLRDGAVPLLSQALDEMQPLAEAFAHFIQSSSRLEEVYRKLRTQINVLTVELAERNADLRESLARNEALHAGLQEIVNAMPCGVLVVRADSTIAVINPECCSLLGIEAQSAMELPRLMARVGETCAQLLGSALAFDMEHEFGIEVEGSVRWVNVRSRGASCGKALPAVYGRIVVLRDVTARHRAEEDRERGRNAMALSEVAMMLAHEVRNPLASLELFSDLIEQDEDRRGRWISELRAGIRMLSGTVNNVLSFQQQRGADAVPVNVDEMVSGAVALLQPVAQQAHVRLLWHSSAAGAVVFGNVAGLQQVAVNLLMNGIRHTPAGGCVGITVSQRTGSWEREGATDMVVVECVDSGPGIAEQVLERLFEAGCSGSGATPGLGLAVCKRIVEQCGGRIDGMNLIEGGAKFVVEIPVTRRESAA